MTEPNDEDVVDMDEETKKELEDLTEPIEPKIPTTDVVELDENNVVKP